MGIVRWIPPVCAVIVACAGGYTDLKTRKIPNKLTIHSMWIGLVLNFLCGGLKGLGGAAGGLLIGFSFFIFFAIGALKAGDVKLYMAVGAMGGWRIELYTMVFSILLGGLAALFVMLTRGDGRKSLRSLWEYGVNMALSRQFTMYKPHNESSYFSYGCCISAGAAAALVYLICRSI